MVRVLPSSVVDRGFYPQSNQTKDFKIGICFFSAKHATLRSKSKDCLAQSGVTCLLTYCCFSMLALLKSTKCVGLVQSGQHHHLIEGNLFSPWYTWKIAHLILNNNYCIHSTAVPILEGHPFCNGNMVLLKG